MCITDAEQWKESSYVLYVLSRMVCFKFYVIYTHLFFFAFLLFALFFVYIVSVSPLFPFIVPFAAVMLLAALINQITNNCASDFFGFVLQQTVLFLLGV